MGHHRQNQLYPSALRGLSILSDLYELIDSEYKSYNEHKHQLYTRQLLQEILLGLHPCKGADAQFFNGHTNITSSRFLVFGVKGLCRQGMSALPCCSMFSSAGDKLLTEATLCGTDELYIWLSDNVAFGTTVIRYPKCPQAFARRIVHDSGKSEFGGFRSEGIRELTKPLFSIRPISSLQRRFIDKRIHACSARGIRV